jgi:enoyl-CoA hydratase/carnithine racemase
MSGDTILVEKTGFVCTLALNRPEKRNSLTPEMLLKIAQHLKDLAKEDKIRTVIIRGEGEKAFSAGYDIGEIPKELTKELMEEIRENNPLEVCFGAIEAYPYPVIAMINGYALGAGCEMAMACDMRIASDGSKMGIPPSRLGLVYHPAGLQRFINVIGLSRAKEVFYTGRYYDIMTAKDMGMVNYVVSKSEIISFTYRLAEEIAGNAPLSLKGHKFIFSRLYHQYELENEDQTKIQEIISESFNSEDFKEGTIAFFEKRKPEFKGK